MSFGIASSSIVARIPSAAAAASVSTTISEDRTNPFVSAKRPRATAPPPGVGSYDEDVPDAPRCASCPWSQRSSVCYTPRESDGLVSCANRRDSDKLVFTMDPRAAVIRAGAIIDSVEFFGVDGFSVKETFSIGLGQMNHDISFPLIVDADSSIANERSGGFREFLSCRADGRNSKVMVATDSFVNVDFAAPVTAGSLQVIVRYHDKNVPVTQTTTSLYPEL